MKPIPFFKLSGAGNDFVLIDGSKHKLPSGPEVARRVCSRQRGIGADGLLIVRRGAAPEPPSIDYFNADGSEAFCGNGTRSAAWWMHRNRWTKKSFSVRTISGAKPVEIAGPERVRLQMPLPSGMRWNIKLKAQGKIWTLHYVEVGVPHAVIFVQDIENVPVVDVGRALRRHAAFKPGGANVNFLRLPGSGKEKEIRIRTYERGVEDETLACGSGTVASAFCAHYLFDSPLPMRVKTQGGDSLTVDLQFSGDSLAEAWLEGPAQITFHGEISL